MIALLFVLATNAPVAPVPVADVTERLGERVPGDIEVMASDGSTVRLETLFDGVHPVVVSLGWYKCPALCNLMTSGQIDAFKKTTLELGRDYRALTASLDVTDGPAEAAERKGRWLQALGRSPDEPSWTFASGEAVPRLADAVGVKWARVESGDIAHPAVLVVLTPDGRVSRYLYGVEFPPRDLRLAVVEASGGRVGTSFDRFLLTCFRYDPASRKYALFVSTFLRTGGLIVLGLVTTLLGFLWKRELAR